MTFRVSRRGLLHFAGITGLSTALSGALRAEGGSLIRVRSQGDLPFAHTTPVRVGAAALRVRDLKTMIAFYQNAIGLSVIAQTDTGAAMGVDGVTLLHLNVTPNAPFEHPSQAGLFHIAFLMPTRADLARWLVHAAHERIPLTGFADHSVSEAVYLDDPEGNGLEVYSDRPVEVWKWQNGIVTMGTHNLDVDSIVALTDTSRDTYTSAPAGLRIGHMHLRVGDVSKGRAFYQAALGLDSTRGNRPDFAFLSSGGYHHHIAINTWNSQGAGPRDSKSTGLDWFSLHVQSDKRLAEQAARLKAASASLADIAGGIETSDPWGIMLRLLRV